MNPGAHYVANSEPNRSLKKSLNRPRLIAINPVPAEKPQTLPTAKIKDALRDWNRDGKLARRSPHTLAARTRIVERFETFLIDSNAACATGDELL